MLFRRLFERTNRLPEDRGEVGSFDTPKELFGVLHLKELFGVETFLGGTGDPYGSSIPGPFMETFFVGSFSCQAPSGLEVDFLSMICTAF